MEDWKQLTILPERLLKSAPDPRDQVRARAHRDSLAGQSDPVSEEATALMECEMNIPRLICQVAW